MSTILIDEAVVKLALEALEELITDVRMCDDIERGERAITALREVLAEPQPEPVAWIWKYANGEEEVVFVPPRHVDATHVDAPSTITPLYTSPPAQQEPVEYWTVANGWVSDQAEVPAAVWVEPDFWEHCNRVNCGTAYRLPAPGRQPLYTSPPAQRKPLTDEQIETVWRSVQANDFHDCVKPFARAIEAAHNIKGDA